MTIRPILRTDLKQCAELFCDTFSSDPWNESWNSARAIERLNHFFVSPGFVGLVAEEQEIHGLVIGNTEPFYSGTIFYLREMCTKSHERGQGIGTKLLSRLELNLKEMHVTSIYLLTNRNIPAAGFYKNRGFNLNGAMEFYSKKISP